MSGAPCGSSYSKETTLGERRVAVVPESCKKLIQTGFDIAVETGAGEAAGGIDDAYQAAGAAVMSDPAALVGSGDLACSGEDGECCRHGRPPEGSQLKKHS
jgi:NAD(P) transhydrogenase subunit alpha